MLENNVYATDSYIRREDDTKFRYCARTRCTKKLEVTIEQHGTYMVQNNAIVVAYAVHDRYANTPTKRFYCSWKCLSLDAYNEARQDAKSTR